jgi:hypothetical protein
MQVSHSQYLRKTSIARRMVSSASLCSALMSAVSASQLYHTPAHLCYHLVRRTPQSRLWLSDRPQEPYQQIRAPAAHSKQQVASMIGIVRLSFQLAILPGEFGRSQASQNSLT